MRLFQVFIALLMAATPVFGQNPGKPFGGATSPAVVARQLAEMNADARRAWSTSILRRLHRANLALHRTAEVSRQYTRNKQVLQHVLSSSPTAPRALEWILAELDRVESEAIAKLEKDYAERIEQVFRNQPDRRDQRKAAWEQVLAAWKGAGSPVGQRGDLVLWLIKAKRNTSPLLVQPLPKMPEFHPDQTALQLAETTSPAAPESTATTKVPELRKPREARHPPEDASSAPSTSRAGFDWQRWKSEWHAGMESKDVQAPLPPAGPSRDLLLLKRRASKWALPHIPPTPDATFSTGDIFWRSFAPKLPLLSSWTPGPSPIPSQTVPTPGRSLASTNGLAEVLSGIKIPLEYATESATRGELPLSSKTSSSRPAPVMEIATSPKRGSASGAVRVTVDELVPLVAGYHLELRALEDDLDRTERADARSLAPLVARLGELMVRRSDLVVFHGLLAEDDQSWVGDIENPRFIVAELAKKIVEARKRALSSRPTGDDAQRRRELRDLDELSRQLAGMVSGK